MVRVIERSRAPRAGGHFRRLSGDTAIYGSGRILLQLSAFVTLPILTRVFTTAQYGVIETVTTVTAVFMLFAPLGLEGASQRSYFDYTDDHVEERRLVLGTAAWTMALSSVVLGALLVAVAVPLAEVLLGSRRFSILFVVTGFTLPITTLLLFTQEVMRLKHRPLHYAALSVFAGVASVALTLYLVLVHRAGVISIFVATLVTSAVALLIGFPTIARSVSMKFSWRHLRIMLAYGLPFIPVAAATWVVQLADRFFLLAYRSPAEVGVYSLGVKYANLLMLAVTAFGIAWSPFFLELYSRNRDEERRVRARALYFVTLLLTWAALAVVASSRAFFAIVTGDDFVEAYTVVGLLAASIVAIGMNVVLISGITITRKTHFFIRYTGYAAVVNIVLNVLLIPPLGIVGAALATLLTYAVLSGFYGWRVQRLDPVRFDWNRIARTILAGAACMVPANIVFLQPLWAEILFKGLLIACFPLVAIAFGAVPPDARSRAAAVFGGLRNRRLAG